MAEIKVAALVGVMTAMAGLLAFSSPARCDTGIVADSFKELDDGEKSRSAKHRWIRLFVRVFFVYVVFATFAGLESVIRRSSMVFTAKPAAGQARKWSHDELARITAIHRYTAARRGSAAEKASVELPTKAATETTSFSITSEEVKEVKARARRAAGKENAFQRDTDI